MDHITSCFSLQKKKNSMLLVVRLTIIQIGVDSCHSIDRKIDSHGIKAFPLSSINPSSVDDVEFIKGIFVQAKVCVHRKK